MSKENGLTPGQMELEAALGRLQPTAVTGDRDRLMYRAGQASARRRNRAWPILSAGLVLMLVVSLLHRPAPQTKTIEVEKLVYITKSAPPTQPALQMAMQTDQPDPYHLKAQAEYVKLRNKVLTEGLGALPIPKAGSSGADVELWREYLPDRKLLRRWKLNLERNGGQS